MDFYLSYNNNEEQLRLPVAPSSFEVSQNHNNTVVNITNLGELNLIGKTGLSSITLTSFFPAHEYYFCKYQGFLKPYECVALLQKWKATNRPIRLIITDTPVNLAVSIESLRFSEKDGTGDVYFTLELKEYVFIKKEKPTIVFTPHKAEVVVKPTVRETKPIPATYTPKKDDNIYKAAKQATGNMGNAKPIAKTNKVEPTKVDPRFYDCEVLLI